MKQMKIVIIAASVLGFIACFLPYVSGEGISLSFWDFHKFPAGNSGLINGPKQVYVAFGCFGIPAVLALLALKGRLSRGLAIPAAVMFLLTFALEGVRKGLSGDHGVSTAIGGKMLFIAALVGLLGSIVATAKPEEA